MARGALAILSTENLLHNLLVIKSWAPQSKIIAMVKANGYGHGLRSVSLRLAPHIASLGVASIDEALALRKVGIKIPITLMEGVFEPEELLIASCENFHIVFHHSTQIAWLKRASIPKKITGWLKIDTGLGRLGFSLDDSMQAYRELIVSEKIENPIGLMSHFACADEQHPLNGMQRDRFRSFVQGFNGPKSLCNSAGAFFFRDDHYDYIRPGIALYGVSPISNISAQELGLKPVMTLQTVLIAVRMAEKGSSIGYGARYYCQENMPIGVIALGYGDGLSRTTRDGAPVLVNGIRCQLVGRVSMDMAMIDLRACPDAKVGDTVVLWGDQLPIEEVVPFTGHSVYDILTAIQFRVKFHWTLDI